MNVKYTHVVLAVLLNAVVVHANQETKSVLTDSTRDVTPIQPGSPIPDVAITTTEGKSVRLPALADGKPTIFIFYRGGWCPYCNAHLSKLREIEGDLTNLGYQLFAISPDRPQKLPDTADKNEVNYTLLSDSSMDAAMAFGIAFRVDENTLEVYKGYGIDLEDASGETHHLLPVPSVFIAGSDGVVAFSHANPDYKVRLDNADILKAAAEALK